jgi:hypothetical protein
MGWRFRQSFKVIPGLRLNLSRSGLSATIGGAPFTVNIGPHGVTGTESLPGTGISYREHVGFPHLPSAAPVSPASLAGNGSNSAPPYSPPLLPTTSSAPIEQVRSASTELLTSTSLKELKKLMLMTFEEHEDITRQLGSARPERDLASARYESWKKGFLFRKLFKKAFAKRQSEAETASAKVAELEEQLRLTTVATHVEIDKEQAEPYFRMRDDFAGMCDCAAIWDVKSHQATDMIHERTTAGTKVERQKVSFSLDTCDLIQWDQKVPHLRNSKGGDLFFYPGFILYRAAKQAFSVIDYHDVNGKGILVQFHEQEGVPGDSKVVGQTWARSNKDGSRDRRFADNFQIPIALYGAVTFKSESGLWEEFQFSNPDRLQQFLNSLGAFVSSFERNAAGATA